MAKRLLMLTDDEIDRVIDRWARYASTSDEIDMGWEEEDQELLAKIREVRLA